MEVGPRWTQTMGMMIMWCECSICETLRHQELWQCQIMITDHENKSWLRKINEHRPVDKLPRSDLPATSLFVSRIELNFANVIFMFTPVYYYITRNFGIFSNCCVISIIMHNYTKSQRWLKKNTEAIYKRNLLTDLLLKKARSYDLLTYMGVEKDIINYVPFNERRTRRCKSPLFLHFKASRFGGFVLTRCKIVQCINKNI